MGMWEDIIAFHDKFGIPVADVPTVELPEELMYFRIKFLQEEVDEFIEAVDAKDDVRAFDALIDLVYVALGTARICNFPWSQGWDIVHNANMKKVRALRKEESKRGTTYDVVKPKGWESPDPKIASLLSTYKQSILEHREEKS